MSNLPTTTDQLKQYEQRMIRTHWDDAEEKWYFSTDHQQTSNRRRLEVLQTGKRPPAVEYINQKHKRGRKNAARSSGKPPK